jgi:hypothetical protein
MWLATPIVILLASLPAAIVASWLRFRLVYVSALVGELLTLLFLRPSVAARYHDPLDQLMMHVRCDLAAAIPGMIAGAAIGWIVFRPNCPSDAVTASEEALHELHSPANADSTAP